MPSLLSWQNDVHPRDECRCLSIENVGLRSDRGHTFIFVLAFTLLCAVVRHLSMLEQLGTGAHMSHPVMREKGG
jgi:hypothetical protein